MQPLSRRQFMVGAAGAGLLAGCGRLPWQRSETARVPRIGYMAVTSPAGITYVDAFQHGLRELGYVEGQNIVVEYREGEWSDERLSELAAELVRLRVDVIVTRAAPATQAARQATDTIPIVFTNINDPVALELVASLARPGGNVTGLSTLSSVTVSKRLELLKEAVPAIARVAVFWDASNPSQVLAFREAQGAAQTLGLQLYSLEVETPDDLDSAFKAAVGERADSLLVLPATPVRYPTQIVDFAAQQQLPAMYNAAEFVRAGGLMAFEPQYGTINRRAAYYVDKILKGAKAADLPVEQPMTFDFVVNMKTAQALGITFPNEIMLQVTEVVQ